jgi:hypothetical protein
MAVSFKFCTILENHDNAEEKQYIEANDTEGGGKDQIEIRISE